VQRLARKRARALEELIDGQLNEIGGDQTLDYISLVRQVVFSGIRYGLGVLEGPYVREETKVLWAGTAADSHPRAARSASRCTSSCRCGITTRT
jgi:hypothetical protein